MLNTGSLTRNGYKPNQNPMNTESFRWQWYGYQDVKDGLGIRKEYEDCEEHIQRNYEMGRAYAALLKYEWGVIPEWKPTQSMVAPINEFWDDEDTRKAFIVEQGYHFKGTVKKTPTTLVKTRKKRVSRLWR